MLEVAERWPDAPALTLLDREERTITRQQLMRRAGSVARQIGEETQPGESVLVALPWGEALIEVLLGTLFSGRVIVPAPAGGTGRATARLQSIAADAGCRVGFGADGLSAVRQLRPQFDLAPKLDPPGQGLALLQYTSGSTSTPKGVQVRGDNLDANLAAIARAFDQGTDDVLVGWLPLFHDMGLIGTLLHPLRNGQHAALMAPASFLAKPQRWLEAISRFGATTSGGPNFGYAWTAGHVNPERLAGIDLSRWRIAFTGSEPISPATISQFEKRFAPVGFRRGSFVPCYGMAETTLLVSAAPVGRPIRVVDGRVGCGMPWEEAVIVADGVIQPDRLVGEIHVRGPSVGNGYRGLADESFGKPVPGRGDGWLRTGDLGFLDRNELFVTGRVKDLIILRGANHHPQDIEELVGAAIPGATVCAFAVNSEHGEGLGIAIEAPGEPDALVEAVRTSVRVALAIEPAAIGVVQGRALPRTTSGKLQRGACRAAWADGGLPLRARWSGAAAVRPPTGPFETGLAAIWSDLLGIVDPPADASFFGHGGASLLAVELALRIEAAFGVAVAPTALIAAASLAEQARLVADAPQAAAPPEPTDTAPMSLQQEGLEMVARLGGGTPTVTVAIEHAEDVDIDAALNRLTARHRGLSTRRDSDGRVHAIPWIPASGAPDFAAGRPFTRETTRGRTILRFDHAVIDGWSVRVLLEEMAALIEGRPLAEAPPDALAWAVAQRSALRAGGGADALAFHAGRWGDTQVALPWPRSDAPGAALCLRSLGWRRDLQAVGAALGVSTAQLVFAAVAVALARLSGQTVVRIGVPIANRDAPWNRTVGCMVSMQAAQVEIGVATTGRALLSAISAEFDALRQQAIIPLEALPVRLGLPRRADLVDVVFDHMALPGTFGPIRLVGGSPLECPAEARVPLTITALETDELRLALLFRKSLMDDDHAAETADLIALALRRFAESPDSPCLGWNFRTERAAKCLPIDVNPIPVPFQPTIVERIFAQPAGAVALSRNGQELSYGELRERALQACGTLRRTGTEAGEIVGVLGSASFDTIAASLGTLAAGAAILSLDRRLPAGRLAMMVREARARTILVADEGEAGDCELGAMLLRAEGPAGERVEVDPGDPAYVVFSTGTTRAPKAILGTHRGLAHFLAWQGGCFGVGADDRFVALTNLAFDMALRDIWLPLTHGARLQLLDVPDQVDGSHIVPFLEPWKITRLHLVPTLARSWLRTAPVTALPSLRSVFFAGEPLLDRLVNQFRRHFPGNYEVLNFYGPSETTQTKIFYRVPEPPLPDVQPIGRPLPDTRIALLNAAGAPCGIGEPGEIVIRTPFATRGYLNAPEEQARRFVSDPLGSGETVYRSGDRGRARLDGAIEILGRGDAQVKVRGTAVNPGEIIDLLEAMEGVRQAAVVAEPTGDGDHQLLAWYVGDRDWASLRSALAAQLPSTLVPQGGWRVDVLPVHPNGKIDTRSLPRPEGGIAVEALPPDALEAELLALWRDALEQPGLDIDADFLDSGGYSLKAFELIEAIRRKLGRTVSPASLLQGMTPRRMAHELVDAPAAAPPLIAIVPDPEQALAPFAMTPVQQAYWVGRRDFLVMGKAAAQTYRELRCPADLDIAALERAFNQLIARHPMLRTVATEEGWQRVLAEVPHFNIAVQDLRGNAKAEAALEAWRAEMSHAVRPLERWPLLEVRVSLLEDEARLHFGLDAFICDAWSRVLLLEELRQRLERSDEPPPLGVTFRDYQVALGQRSLDEDWSWWRERLDGLPSAPQLPLVRRVAEGFTRRHSGLPRDRWQAFQRRAQQAGLTASAALLAAFGWVLARWSGQDRLAINVTVFQRQPVHPDINRVIGDFTTVLPHSAEIDGSNFRAYARADQVQLWRELAHSAVSGVDLAREAARRSGRIDAVAYPVVFTSALTTPELAREFDWSWLGELVHGISQTPQVWLDLQVYEHAGELHCNWDCVEGLFAPGVVDAMVAAWGELLAQLCAEPWDVVALDLLPQADAAMIAQANDTAVAGSEETLIDRVRACAAATPDAPAVIAPGHSLSYAELVAEAECVAAAVIDAGVAREDLVAILAPHGWRQAVAALGVLMAGAAYLPINLDQPCARIGRIIAEAKPALLLRTSTAWDDGLVLEALPREARGRRDPRPGDLAYVIYTSGSTGTPKGVAIRHRMAVNTLADLERRMELGPQHHALALSALSFDLSVWDLFGTWRIGAALVYPADRNAPEHWLAAVRSHHVRLWNSVPMVAQMMVDWVDAHAGGDFPKSLDRILLSGDWIPVELASRLRREAPTSQLWSLGGATEGSIWSIGYLIDQIDADWSSIPYGRPLANQTMHVLDSAMRPCPAWVTGRLFIGGAGVAAGYWRREDLTAERFVEWRGERLYDTGDLGRWRDNGQIELLGRVDQQVKIRGHRIEIGEIEHVLETLPGVAHAVVVVRGGGSKPRHLAAFIAPSGPDIDLESLRRTLAEWLPDPMVPTRWTRLDRLPLGANGKVDRAALTEACEAVPGLRIADGAEATLAAAWTEILGAPPSHPALNFFAAGGDSVTWIRLCARVSRNEWHLPNGAITHDASFAGLAAQLMPSDATRLDPDGPAPLAPMQRWLAAQGWPGHFNQAILLRHRSPLASAQLREAIVVATAAHPAFGLRIEGDKQNFVAKAPMVEFAEALDAMSITRACRGFEADGALLRATLFDDHLLLCAHHGACDAHSWRILVEDIEDALAFLDKGLPAAVPGEATSFGAWCRILADRYPPPKGIDAPIPTVCLADPTPPRLFRRVLRAGADALQRITEHQRCSQEEAMAAAALFAQATCGGRGMLVLERNGRAIDGVDASRTVGWTTALTPVAGPCATAVEALRTVKSALRALPDGGAGESWRCIASGAMEDMVVNPLGSLTEVRSRHFELRRDIALPVFGLGLKPPGQIRLTLAIEPEGLAVELLDPGDGAALLDALDEAFGTLLNAPPDASVTPTDFPDSGLDEADLRAFLAELEV